ncbi:Response regulator receiver domain-containing protein [Flavobacterium swingsii]|jgi:two-component system OmpR family response regulator|uniref:Response regulator receiver domain-containing protein n=1 Tax=Flavobacterium swingsii TaxID=498292 RepID=A0A1I0WVC8_9FLAO|nr:response regulator [Flavobacterium swingsii]SFA92367.1 Response regulator receiver domain-containing protein [Flavobacterium swingsii]
MENQNKIKIFLVDDDAFFLKSLEIQFLNQGEFEVETFATGELCIENLSKNPQVIILDYYLDGVDENAMDGIKTLDKIKEFNTEIHVVILSSQDQIEVAVDCMHHKALDYVVKNETAFLRLQKIIDAVFKYQKIEKRLNWLLNKM